MSSQEPPRGVDVFQPNSPCSPDKCPIEWSMFGYRPWLAANIVFLVLFALIGVVHTYLGFRWRSWGFMTGIWLGCIAEILGYAGRIMMSHDPFSYYGFMIQIICLTIAPIFYTASIYVTLSKTINAFAPDLSRFKPKLFYWIFIPFDIVCLVLQAIGGALSTSKHDGKRTGVNISMAGLILQVIVILLFLVAFADYMVRLVRSGRARQELGAWRSLTFFAGLVTACLFILTRCAYRVAELKDGYGGKLFREQVPFIVLEGVMVVAAGVALMFGHPGLVIDKPDLGRGASGIGKHSHSDSDDSSMPMGQYGRERIVSSAGESAGERQTVEYASSTPSACAGVVASGPFSLPPFFSHTLTCFIVSVPLLSPPACMNRLRIAPIYSARLPLTTPPRRTRHHHDPRPTPQILATSFSTSSLTMAPPKAALDFVDFVNASPTPYHAVAAAAEILAKAGFQQIHERDSWASSVRPGGKYYVTRNGSSIAAFAVGHKWRAGNPVSVVGAHTDSCCLRLKPVSKKSQVGYDQIAVEKYGGGIWTSWFDRDLSLAGRVLVRQGGSIVAKLVKVDKPLVRIPTLAIHLHRQSSFDPNTETEMLPITALAEQQLNKAPANGGRRGTNDGDDGDEDFQPLADMVDRHHPAVLDIIANEAGVSVDAIVDFEMMLYDTQDACLGGINDEFVFAPRLDNLEMTYCSIEGLVASVEAKDALDGDGTIRMAVCFDHEEIGSKSAQGAHSNMLPAVLRRLAVLPGSRDATSDKSYEHVSAADAGGEESTAFEQTLARSFLVSADMAHAVHPNYVGKYEGAHQPAMNKGTVIKVNASQKYATNSPGIALLQECARAAEVPLQLFVVRNDSLCGSTIGPGLAALLGVRTIDVGNAQLSMHSIRETGGTTDIPFAIKLFKEFYASYGVMEPKILID
ncbi:hypothetical protein PWT90_08819 [Aphanocladium album]|nr:hypothetical protein PWT90_08819 [Aphanocladium album]